MKLRDLFQAFPEVTENIFSDLEIQGLAVDSRKVVPGSVFVAISGAQADGHDFITKAIDAGAKVLVVESTEKIPSDFDGFILKVLDSRAMVDHLASQFYQHPSLDLFCIGVTGTNGKTSITYFCEALFAAENLPMGVIGTVNHHLQDKVWPSEMTTPDAIFLQKRLREFLDAGAFGVTMEVSSHALHQKRVDSVAFNSVIFTNLTRDHLDYHGTMEMYFEAKQRLFKDLLWSQLKSPQFAIVNVDDSWGRKIKVPDHVQVFTYGEKNADYVYKIKKMTFSKTEFELLTPRGMLHIELPMAGRHNVANAVAAFIAAESAGIPRGKLIVALKNFTGVPGRLQFVPTEVTSPTVLVDYAHSPDALENVLSALVKIKEETKSASKIWTIFGCGGDRDKGKRPLMAEIAIRLSDHVMITSDNPRTESPEQIIADIIAGISEKDISKWSQEVDRKNAIHQVLGMASSEDVVLIAGKGHEDYQIIGNQKTHFSDYEVAQNFLKGQR